VDCDSVESNIALLRSDLLSKAKEALGHEKMRLMAEKGVEADVLLSYFDADLDAHVVLEADSWGDFMQQAKKMLRVALIEVEAPSPVASNAQNHIDIDIEDSLLHNLPSDQLSTVASPMSPDDGINDSSRSSEAKVGEWMPTNGTGPEIGSELIMVNGIKVVGLRRRLVFELLSQRSRPLLLLFRKKVDQTSPNPKREYLSPSNHVASTYDDEWDSGDEGAVSEGASVTGSAAGAAAIQFSIGRGPTWARKRKAFVNESLSIVPADIDYLSYDMFLSKYFAPQGIRMRKKVDESISAFLAFNWKEYSSPNTQQETIKSLYKYIETELLRLGMFNKKLQQGSDAPDMTDRYKARLRMHIERFVMAKVKSLISDPTSPAFKSLESYPETVNRLKREAAFNDASNDVLEDFGKFHFATLSERIAFLRFLTLEDLGLTLELPLSLDYISKLLRFGNMSGESDGSISSSRQFREDWNIAMSEVVDALSKMSRSPSDVSRRIQSAVALAMSAAERYLATGNVYREQVMTVPVYPKDKRSSTGVAEEYRNMFRKMPAGATLINQHRPALGADELLPMVTWLLIQANPQTAELCLCYCSEFLNPELARGQAYYNLAQVMSALEFIKSAGPDELLCSMHPSGAEGDQEEEIKTQRRKVLAKYASFYNSSLNLLKACKRGDVHGVEKWLDRGADINMYSPDQRNTPLTMAVRYSQKDVMKKLLTYIPSKSNKNDDPKTILDVNLPVGIINADLPPHRITALHIAVSIGDTEAVIELLKAGADRYAKDREGHDPLDVAIKAEFSEIAKVLLADPEVHALVPAVLSGHVAIVEGLLKQGAVVDAIDSNYGISALIAAIHAMHECILAILLSQYKICSQIMLSGIIAAGQITLQPFSLDSKDSSGATALMWCGKAKSLVHGLKSAVQAQQDYYYSLEEVDPQNVRDIDDLTRMKLAIRLCAAGANRYVVDHEGRSAFWWAIHGGGAADDLDLTTKQLREKLQVAQEKSKKTSSSLISVLDVCKFPRLAAVLYYDPEKFSIFELARDNCFEGVRALLDQGADPNSVCPVDGYSAILAAAYNSNSSILELLVADRRTDLNFCNYRMGAFTALHYCASRGDAVMCGRLLYAGACRTPQSKTGKTPYDLAMERGHKLAADVCRYDPEKVSICLAAKHGDIGITRILLLQGVSINTSRRHKTLTGKSKNQLYSPLIAACVYGRVDYIQFLFAVSDGAFDPHRNDECIRRETLLVDLANPDGNTALMCAAMVGNEQIVLLLLNRGNANRYLVDAGGRTAADWAQRYEHKVVHEILINDPERCSIHHCAARGDLRSVVALLKQKVETNLRFAGEATSRGTSIHPPPSQAPAATSSLSPSSPSLASIPPPPPPTQLHYFIMGETPLAVAARFNALPILRLLLQAPDILIDARDEEGVTALGRAAQTGHEDCVLELLNHKANRYIGKKKPVDLALASGHVTVAALIEADAERVSCHDLVESGRVRSLGFVSFC
jgi:ankyrin repeat protein